MMGIWAQICLCGPRGLQINAVVIFPVPECRVEMDIFGTGRNLILAPGLME